MLEVKHSLHDFPRRTSAPTRLFYVEMRKVLTLACVVFAVAFGTASASAPPTPKLHKIAGFSGVAAFDNRYVMSFPDQDTKTRIAMLDTKTGRTTDAEIPAPCRFGGMALHRIVLTCTTDDPNSRIQLLTVPSGVVTRLAIHGDSARVQDVANAYFDTIGRYWVAGRYSSCGGCNKPGQTDVYVNRFTGEVRSFDHTIEPRNGRDVASPNLTPRPRRICGLPNFDAYEAPYIVFHDQRGIVVRRCTNPHRSVVIARCDCNVDALSAGFVTWHEKRQFMAYRIRTGTRYHWPINDGRGFIFATRYAILVQANGPLLEARLGG